MDKWVAKREKIGDTPVTLVDKVHYVQGWIAGYRSAQRELQYRGVKVEDMRGRTKKAKRGLRT
jgi:hypothetical protein